MATYDLTHYAQSEKQMPLLAMLSSDQAVKRFEMVCGKEAGTVIINIVNAATANPEIYECEPDSVVTAALNAATLKLSLAPGMGHAAILPFNKYKKQGNDWIVESKKAQFVLMVRGVKELAMRTNKYRILNAFRVYDGQEFVTDQLTGAMHIEGKKVSDKIKGYGAYLKLFNGYEAAVYWPVEKIIAHAQRFSPSWNKREKKFNDKSRWVTDFDQSAEKTVIKDLILNHGVISDNDRATLATIDDDRTPGLELAQDVDIIDGETKDDEQPPTVPAPAQPSPTTPDQRPYAPEVLRTKFAAIVAQLEADPRTSITPVDRQIVAKTIKSIFDGDDTRRYTVCRWLTGIASTKEMSAAQIRALMKVTGVHDFGGVIDPNALIEFRQAYSAAIVAEGQQNLL